MVLLWGVPADSPIAAVEAILRRDRVPYAFLDQRAVLDTEVVLTSGQEIEGILRVSGDEVSMGEIKAVYARPYDVTQFQQIAEAGEQSPEFQHAVALHQALSIWLDLTPAVVLNRPREMALNYSKPYQAAMIERSGFAVPETLLTTDPGAVHDFRRRRKDAIYKSISSIRSIVTQVLPEDEERLVNVTWCPTQFQQRITGTEVRAHVIRDEVFACEIVSEANDYRYAPLSGKSLELQPYDLPDECAARCRALCAGMNFIIAGVDLRCENGTWYCFEVNPSPGFMYYQEKTGQPIDEAIARILAEACGTQQAATQ